MKKILYSLLTVLLTLSGIAACGKEEPKNSGAHNGTNPGFGTGTEVVDPEENIPDAPTTPVVPGRVVIAYVTSWSSVIPDGKYMTHINYAFGHVSESFNGVGIANESRLSTIAKVKDKYPDLKIMLSIGGWGSGRFSEMAADDNLRLAFAKDCKRVCDQYNLDGIDIDWEFPTSNSAGISSSPDDTKNFTKLMRDIREAIGDNKFLTLATVCTGDYIDFPGIMPYVDFVNIMAYDMAGAPQHNAALHRSGIAGYCTSEEAVQAHLKKGVPAEKLVLGVPFYGHGMNPYDNNVDYKYVSVKSGCTKKWDDTAKVPYIVNGSGTLVLGYDDPKSLGYKCRYALDKGLLGIMYWDYDGDNARNELRSTVAKYVLGK